ALGVLAHGAELDGGEADHVEQFIDAALALALREFEELAVIVQRLAGVEEGVEVGLFGQVADATLDADIGGELAEDAHAAAGLVQQAEDDLDRGALAGAVGAEQAEDL